MRELISNALAVLGIILMIPGCGQQSKILKAAAPSKRYAASSFTGLETHIDIAAVTADHASYNPEIEAKLNDIPTMVGSVPIETELMQPLPEGQQMFAFACQYDQEMVANFYLFEMEQQGWQRIGSVKSFETVLIFQKPKKLCIVSVRSLATQKNSGCQSLAHITLTTKEK